VTLSLVNQGNLELYNIYVNVSKGEDQVLQKLNFLYMVSSKLIYNSFPIPGASAGMSSARIRQVPLADELRPARDDPLLLKCLNYICLSSVKSNAYLKSSLTVLLDLFRLFLVSSTF
jgi:hypothetical protein